MTKERPAHRDGTTHGIPAPHSRWLIPALLLALVAAMVLALAVGSVSIPPIKIVLPLFGQLNDDVTGRILFGTRLPRVLVAGLVGAALALSGLASQTLLRNPLASPSVIGVSNGAAFGAVAGGLLGVRLINVGYGLSTAFSITSGVAVTALVFMLEGMDAISATRCCSPASPSLRSARHLRPQCCTSQGNGCKASSSG